MSERLIGRYCRHPIDIRRDSYLLTGTAHTHAPSEDLVADFIYGQLRSALATTVSGMLMPGAMPFFEATCSVASNHEEVTVICHRLQSP